MKTVDDYIATASESMKPVLLRLRHLVHRCAPEIKESIKWSAPNFEIDGQNLCSVMAFNKHVNFVFYQGKQLGDPRNLLENIGEKSTMKGIKKITEIADLPDEETLISYIQEAVQISRTS